MNSESPVTSYESSCAFGIPAFESDQQCSTRTFDLLSPILLGVNVAKETAVAACSLRSKYRDRDGCCCMPPPGFATAVVPVAAPVAAAAGPANVASADQSVGSCCINPSG